MVISKETIKTFLLYFTITAIIILSINTYVQNQQLQEMQEQIRELQDLIINNQQLLNNNKNLIGNLSNEENSVIPFLPD